LLDSWEWIIIGIIAVVIIMWGPSKIPEFARAIGRARGEFDKASKEFTAAATTTASTPSLKTKDEILIDTARNMGISTEGKTREQLSNDIAQKAKEMGA
jgi:sec-independent protein translocase protein TatA